MILLRQFLEEELNLDPGKYMPDFIVYEKLLLDWNKKINLVSRKSDSIEDHILNSIFFLTKYKLKANYSIADIGTGGGFPGIPLKILFPEIKVLLVDSIRKKISVLIDIIEKMKLENVEAVCGRSEEISKDAKYKNKFDYVISKAVAPLDKLYEWGNNFLNANGETLCIKGGNINEELNQLNNLRYKFNTEVINFNFKPAYMIEDKKLVIIK